MLAELLELSIIIWNESILISHSSSDDVEIGDGTVIDLITKKIWLLALTVPSIVVSGEWVERSNNVPSSTELSSSIAKESTDI